LDKLAIKYDVKPERVANYPHLEIAAIFLSYCTSYFLKDSGRLAFVLPRSFYNADHHDNTRAGKAKGFRLTSTWDLNNVQPLFRIPSCVLFAEKANAKRETTKKGITAISFKGNLPGHNVNWATAAKKLVETETNFYYVKQGKSSALSEQKKKAQTRINPYKNLFKQGATIVPRTFYFVELTQPTPPDFEDRIIQVKTSDAVQPDAKAPWKGLNFSGAIESKFLFRTALSKSILPFVLYKPDLVVLPVEKSVDNKLLMQTHDELMRSGYLNASRWFEGVSRIWDLQKTEKSKNMSSNDRIDFQRGITEQDLNSRYLVLYNSSAKDANATVVNRADLDLDFIVESVTYVLYTDDAREANYLVGILNSTVPNELMKDFQAKGLFGARHVHKKILDVYYPKFDEKNETHLKLAELGELANMKAKEYLSQNPPQQELSAIHLGKLRVAIKKHLSKEMAEIDKIVKKLIV
jgi:hypothetical protein